MDETQLEELAWYAFSLEGDRCRQLFDNRNRLWISYQVNYLEMRDDYALSDALLLH